MPSASLSQVCSSCFSPCSRSCVCMRVFYCSDQCQKADWTKHKEECPRVSIQTIDNVKGRGMVAIRAINPGQEVLSEKPLIHINGSVSSRKYHQEEVLSKYHHLSRSSKAEYNSLRYINREVVGNKILNIWYSNCVGIRVLGQLTVDDEEEKGLYLSFSMINHSCAPNAVINFDESRKVKVVAITKIRRGEEIVINYLDPTRGENLLRFERQKILRNMWRFNCRCVVCSLKGQELERNESMKKNLVCLVEKQKQFQRVPVQENAMNRLSLEVEIMDLMRKIGLEMAREIPDSLHYCYFYAKILQIQGVSLAQSPDQFRKVAYEDAKLLGESFLKKFHLR